MCELRNSEGDRVAASNAPVYTRRSLLVADDPQAPSDRRSCVRCTSRRWRLLACPYWAEMGRPAYLGECTAAGGSTTARFRVVSKCALSRGPTKRTERPGHPGRSRFGSLLLVDHRLSSLFHFATNEPSANVM